MHRCTHTGASSAPPSMQEEGWYHLLKRLSSQRKKDKGGRVRDNRPVCLQQPGLSSNPPAERQLIDERRAPLTASFGPFIAAPVTLSSLLFVCRHSVDSSVMAPVIKTCSKLFRSVCFFRKRHRIRLLWLLKYTHLMCYCAEVGRSLPAGEVAQW